MTNNNNHILTIDAGNTRIKWGLFDAAGNITSQGACLHTELAQLTLPPAGKTVISNVAGNGIEAHLNHLLEQHDHVQFISSQASACGVQNHYTAPAKLGTDRWAALIAAWHYVKSQGKQSPCVVVNAGTAVTIDAIDNAAFNGGLIIPGMDLMQQSLYLATAQLPIEAARDDIEIDILAKNTHDAILAGTLYAISGAIVQMAQTLHAKTQQAPWILISGGNAAIIHRHVIKAYSTLSVENHVVTNHAVIVDNLVLQGLFLLGMNQ